MSRLVVVLAIALALGGMVGTAGADCAWVLYEATVSDSGHTTRKAIGAYDTRDQCLAEIKTYAFMVGPPGGSATVIPHASGAYVHSGDLNKNLQCWPDTVKP